ncbi:hypothetical protein BD626DRAFT_487859, partial [Schizophyllum amplum]
MELDQEYVETSDPEEGGDPELRAQIVGIKRTLPNIDRRPSKRRKIQRGASEPPFSGLDIPWQSSAAAWLSSPGPPVPHAPSHFTPGRNSPDASRPSSREGSPTRGPDLHPSQPSVRADSIPPDPPLTSSQVGRQSTSSAPHSPLFTPRKSLQRRTTATQYSPDPLNLF